jgi:hypothetical protein
MSFEFVSATQNLELKTHDFRNGGCSSMAERFTVDEDVAGSSPVSHPNVE